MSTLTGLLLMHADPKMAESWVSHGVVPSYVVPVPGWTAVVPAGESQAAEPYTDALTVMANRPVPGRVRPALGFFVIDDVAVVTMQTAGWRGRTRMLSWTPGHGRDDVPGFTPLGIEHLTEVVGLDRADVPDVHAVLKNHRGRPVKVLQRLMHALALPGAGMLEGHGVKSAEDAVFVEPDRQAVKHFERIARDEADMHAELRENS